MAGRVIVDANVLVYAFNEGAPFQSEARARLAELEGEGGEIWVSRQILREYLVVVTRPMPGEPPIGNAMAIAQVKGMLRHFHVADETAEVTANLLVLLGSTPTAGKQVHDANIVATMLAHDIGTLLTHNTADFKRFGDYITVSPLIAEEAAG